VCGLTMRYRSRRSNDAELRARLRALAHERRRFGYRRLHVFLKQEGFRVNPAAPRGPAWQEPNAFTRTAMASRMSRHAAKSRCAHEWDGWGRLSDDGPGHYSQFSRSAQFAAGRFSCMLPQIAVPGDSGRW
jgi:hypothetical protein